MHPFKLVAAVAAVCLAPLASQAQGKFPEPGQTFKLVVPFAAGGGVDTAARRLAEELRKQQGLTVVVENRAGGSGTVGGRAVQSAPADGTTLLFSAATHVLAKQVLPSVPYDPQADFTPVARVGEAPLMLVIAPRRPQQKLAEVITAARKEPGKWTAAIPAAGAPSHLATLLLAREAGMQPTYVSYKGTQPALLDVAGGHVDMLMDSMVSLLPLAKAGKVRPIAVTSKQRTALAPEVPTVREGGLANFEYATWYGVWAPKGTPPERVEALNSAINAAVKELARSGVWASLGIEPVTESPEQFKKFIATDVAQGTELLKAAGFRPE